MERLCVRNPRIILSELEFTLGQSLQLRFVKRKTKPAHGYDVSLHMDLVDAIYKDGLELWRNMHCQNPRYLDVKGLQVVFTAGTVISFDKPLSNCKIDGRSITYGSYIEAVFDESGGIHYDRNGRHSRNKLEIIPLFDNKIKI